MESLEIPIENEKTYRYLYAIENGLREFIIDRLSVKEGNHWHKTRLPGDILKKFREGIDAERRTSWAKLVIYHPIYYIDFPDLVKIIAKNDNWRDVFEVTFKRKDIFMSALSEIEFIRNKIAHNRKVIQADLDQVKNAYIKMEAWIGKDCFSSLVLKSTIAREASNIIKELLLECEDTYLLCLACEELTLHDNTYATVKREWWFDEDLLGGSIQEVKGYFALVEEYILLPRNRGTGHNIERWVQESHIKTKYPKACDELTTILSLRSS